MRLGAARLLQRATTRTLGRLDSKLRQLNVFTSALLVFGVLVAWVVTLVATVYMAVFHLPLSMLESLLLIVSAPTKFGFRTVVLGLFLWFVVMTANQCLALGWLLGYAVIKDWAYSTSIGDTISAFYFAPSAVASIALVYKFRRQFYGLLS